MMTCDFNEVTLLSWLDGESGSQAFGVQSHVEDCSTCQGRLEAARRGRRLVRDMVESGVGAVEPLLALQEIRRRIADTEARSAIGRAGGWWQDMWMFNRRALAGLGLAAALGALCAPAAVWWLGPRFHAGQADGVQTTSVVVESLEVQDNAKAVVVQGDKSTTLIWVEPVAAAAAAAPPAPSPTPKEPAPHDAAIVSPTP